MDTRLVIAGAVAGVAIVIAGWMGYSQFGGGRHIRSASQAVGVPGPTSSSDQKEQRPPAHALADQGGEMPRWVTEDPAAAPGTSFHFARHSSPGEAGAALGGALGAMRDLAEASTELSNLGAAPKFGVVDGWLEFTQPLIADDKEAFVSVYERLGGVMNADGEDPSAPKPPEELFRKLREHYAGASIDTSQIIVRSADVTKAMEVPVLMKGPNFPKMTPGQTPVMMARLATVGIGDNGEQASGAIALSLPLELVFPDAAKAAANRAPVVELWAPMRLAGQKGDAPDVGSSTYLVWNSKFNAWQPLGIRLKLRSEEAQARMPKRGG